MIQRLNQNLGVRSLTIDLSADVALSHSAIPSHQRPQVARRRTCRYKMPPSRQSCWRRYSGAQSGHCKVRGQKWNVGKPTFPFLYLWLICTWCTLYLITLDSGCTIRTLNSAHCTLRTLDSVHYTLRTLDILRLDSWINDWF